MQSTAAEAEKEGCSWKQLLESRIAQTIKEKTKKLRCRVKRIGGSTKSATLILGQREYFFFFLRKRRGPLCFIALKIGRGQREYVLCSWLYSTRLLYGLADT